MYSMLNESFYYVEINTLLTTFYGNIININIELLYKFFAFFTIELLLCKHVANLSRIPPTRSKLLLLVLLYSAIDFFLLINEIFIALNLMN